MVLREIHRRGPPPGWAAGPAPAEAFDDPSGPFFEGMSVDDPLRPVHLNAKLLAMRPLPKRYVDGSRRLMEVLDTRLEGRDYIVDEYSIADMATYPSARVEVDDLPHLKAWFDRIDARPAARRALTIPKAQPRFWDATADDGALAAENAARFASGVKKD